MDGSGEIGGLRPAGEAVQAALSKIANDRLRRISALFGQADGAAYRLRHDKLAEARRLHNVPCPTFPDSRDARVRQLIAEAAALHAELGGMIAGLRSLLVES
jgi:hypothetical protein